MENLNEAKQLISEAKNIYIIPDQGAGKEAQTSALALFYTLKEIGKNVNLSISDLPENLKFLIPSLDFISYPKNFVVSIPSKIADVSQIYYEKDEQGLKVHLTLDKGIIKKDDVSFYYSEVKPDLVITLGIKDFKEEMAKKMDSFGFLLDAPILNIDNESVPIASPSSIPDEVGTKNKNFGKINLLRDSSISELALDLVKNPHIESVNKEAATCFLAGIASYTENFGNSKVNPEIFETASLLMKRGADLKIIKENIFT